MNAPIIPIPRSPVTVRPATAADLPFIDSLQKLHAKQVGWMPMKSLEQKIVSESVLIAEEVGSGQWAVGREEGEVGAALSSSALPTAHCRLPTIPVGYCIATDRYMKREDCGVIYQVNVLPGHQRGLVGATLLRAQFERSAYGCRLYCCWCAQDIEANRFWESLGFIPLAYRAGSRDKGRVHIFWQRRVRAGDETTPYWFPSQTTGGAIREDRLVFPIPPGVSWRDAMPVVLPESKDEGGTRAELATARERMKDEKAKALPSPRGRASASSFRLHPSSLRRDISSGGLRFPAAAAPKPAEPEPKPEPAPKQKVRNDPRLVAAARELRDRYLEHVNARGLACGAGKYDVGRRIGEASAASATMTIANHARPRALPAPVAPAA